MPTGIALRDARSQLFAAAERVLAREGVSGLTSRAVTDEAGVAKGVLHRHFHDFDDFLAELVHEHIAALDADAATLAEAVGTATVVANLADALARLFTPDTLGIVGVVNSRAAVRVRVRRFTPRGVPIFTEATSMLASYLRAEREAGRLLPRADPDALAFALIGTGHLLFAGELGGLPDAAAVAEVVESIVVGALPGSRRDADLPQHRRPPRE